MKSFFRWLRDERGFKNSDAPPSPHHVKTSFSATVFSGESNEWVTYLSSEPTERYSRAIRIDIHVNAEARKISFVGHNEASTELARHLGRAITTLQKRVRRKPFVARELEAAIFTNSSNLPGKILLRVSPMLPCEASREVPLGDPQDKVTSTIVLRESVVLAVMRDIAQAGLEFEAP